MSFGVFEVVGLMVASWFAGWFMAYHELLGPQRRPPGLGDVTIPPSPDPPGVDRERDDRWASEPQSWKTGP